LIALSGCPAGELGRAILRQGDLARAEEIIRELGITRGALYHQFKDKQGVFEAVIAQAHEEVTASIAALRMPPPAFPLRVDWMTVAVPASLESPLKFADQVDRAWPLRRRGPCQMRGPRTRSVPS
jgi:AcrR family transcriptional regulator